MHLLLGFVEKLIINSRLFHQKVYQLFLSQPSVFVQISLFKLRLQSLMEFRVLSLFLYVVWRVDDNAIYIVWSILVEAAIRASASADAAPYSVVGHHTGKTGFPR